MLLSDSGCIQPDVRSRESGPAWLPACLLPPAGLLCPPAGLLCPLLERGSSEHCLCSSVLTFHINWQGLIKDQPHQIMRWIINLHSMWKIQKSQCIWKVHLISTFFFWECAWPRMHISIPSQIAVDCKSVHFLQGYSGGHADDILIHQYVRNTSRPGIMLSFNT